MKRLNNIWIVASIISATACMSTGQRPQGPVPTDPIAQVGGAELRARGLVHARRGDLVRAQQYLSAALQKGFDENVILPELVKVCVASSRLRAALEFAEPYLERHPEDGGMHYVVGTLHMTLGNLEEASAYLTEALRTKQLAEDALFSLGVLAFKRGQTKVARAHLERYLEERPQGRHAHRIRSMLVRFGGDS